MVVLKHIVFVGKIKIFSDNLFLYFRGEICLTNQTGSRPLTEDNMQKAISLATNQAQEIRNALQKLR